MGTLFFFTRAYPDTTDDFIFMDLRLEKIEKTNRTQTGVYYDNYYGVKEIQTIGLFQYFDIKKVLLRLNYENKKRFLYHFNDVGFKLEYFSAKHGTNRDFEYGFEIGSSVQNTPWKIIDTVSADFGLLIKYKSIFLYLQQSYYFNELQDYSYFLNNTLHYQINERISVGGDLLYSIYKEWERTLFVVYKDKKTIFKIAYQDNPARVILTFSWLFHNHFEIQNSALLNPVLGVANRLTGSYWWQ